MEEIVKVVHIKTTGTKEQIVDEPAPQWQEIVEVRKQVMKEIVKAAQIMVICKEDRIKNLHFSELSVMSALLSKSLDIPASHIERGNCGRRGDHTSG